MPEYLAPGVYIEETSFRSKSIEGVSTSTAGFVGPTRFGPITGDPELLTSFTDFERIYGGLEDLVFNGKTQTNYLAHAVRAFFEEGGKRLYVSRVFSPSTSGDPRTSLSGYARADVPAPQTTTPTPPQTNPSPATPPQPPGPAPAIQQQQSSTAPGSSPQRSKAASGSAPQQPQGTAAPPQQPGPTPGTPPQSPGAAAAAAPGTQLVARFPGAAGNMRLTFTLQVGTNALVKSGGNGSNTLTRVQSYDLVHVRIPGQQPVRGAGISDGLHLVRWDAVQSQWLLDDDTGATEKTLTDLLKDNSNVQVRPVTVTVDVASPNGQGFASPLSLGSFGFDPRSSDGLTSTFTLIPGTRSQFLTTPFTINLSDATKTALAIVRSLMGNDVIFKLFQDSVPVTSRQAVYTLANGNDGNVPGGAAYEGDPDESQPHDLINVQLDRWKNGLLALEGLEDVSIVAAPGYSFLLSDERLTDEILTIHNALISHCEKMRYRIAVLDTPPNQLVSEALAFRNMRSSTYAALYYPWVTIADPLGTGRLNLPPSGFMAGIYARNDINRSVSKAPANEVIGSAIDFEQRLNKAQQEVLNPEGVNCLRFFAGRGFLVWGARTISDDPEWKYVNLRRYFAYLEHSIERGTQWVVFENNSQQLWDNVRHTIEDFLLNEWKMGSLMGSKPEEAYFVRCDLSTMTQNDLDNGRLVCLIGVAAVRPAEFVIFRIGQWTANTNV
jgi:phage tail sheath protein FI